MYGYMKTEVHLSPPSIFMLYLHCCLMSLRMAGLHIDGLVSVVTLLYTSSSLTELGNKVRQYQLVIIEWQVTLYS